MKHDARPARSDGRAPALGPATQTIATWRPVTRDARVPLPQRGHGRGRGALPALRHERRRRCHRPAELHARRRRAARGRCRPTRWCCRRGRALPPRSSPPRCGCSARPGAPRTRRALPPGVERPSTEAVFRRDCPWRRRACASSWASRSRTRCATCSSTSTGAGSTRASTRCCARPRPAASSTGPSGGAREPAAGDALGYEQDAARSRGLGRRPSSPRRSRTSGGGPLRSSSCCATAPARDRHRGPRVSDGAGRAARAAGPAPRLGRLAALDAPALHDRDPRRGGRRRRPVAHAAGGRGRRAARADRRDRGARRQPAPAASTTRAAGASSILETDQAGDGVFEAAQPLSPQPLAPRGPRLVAAATIGPETLAGASPFGTYAALLFDRVVSEADAADSRELRDRPQLRARREAPALGPAGVRGARAAGGPARADRASPSAASATSGARAARRQEQPPRLAPAAAGRGGRAAGCSGRRHPVPTRSSPT